MKKNSAFVYPVFPFVLFLVEIKGNKHLRFESKTSPLVRGTGQNSLIRRKIKKIKNKKKEEEEEEEENRLTVLMLSTSLDPFRAFCAHQSVFHVTDRTQKF